MSISICLTQFSFIQEDGGGTANFSRWLPSGSTQLNFLKSLFCGFFSRQLEWLASSICIDYASGLHSTVCLSIYLSANINSS